MNSTWENFDRQADACVRKQITFAAFVRAAESDFARLARIATRRRRLPSHMDVEEVKWMIIDLAWHYLFTRKCQNGAVGFEPFMYRSAGSYCRWKVQKKIGKIISRAKGENQHKRLGPGKPEFLSKTGELPEAPVDSRVEAGAEVAIELAKLERVCETAREFAMLRAIVASFGERDSIVMILTSGDQPTFASAKEARVALDSFQLKIEQSRLPGSPRRREVAKAAA